MDNLEDGMGMSNAYFEKEKKGKKLLEVLSKSSSCEAERNDRNK